MVNNPQPIFRFILSRVFARLALVVIISTLISYYIHSKDISSQLYAKLLQFAKQRAEQYDLVTTTDKQTADFFHALLRADNDDFEKHTKKLIFNSSGQIFINSNQSSITSNSNIINNDNFSLLLNAAKKNVRISSIIDDAKLDYIYALVWMDKSGLYYAVEYPKSRIAWQAFHDAKYVLYVGMLTLLAALLVVGLTIKRHIVQPLRELIAATRSISENNKPMLTSQAISEFKSIKYAFNQMAEEIKARDESLEYNIESLWNENQRRTNELRVALEDAQRAKEAAEEAAKVKSQFLAQMSHEIRTPLNGIIGMTELTLETELSEEQRSYLELVRASSNSLLSIINDVLDFSKIEAGKIALESININIREIIDRCVALVSVRADQKELVLVSKVESTVPNLIIGDEVRISQILMNLLSNAVKFTSSHGAIFLYCSLDSISNEKVNLHFSVTDTGIGIPEDKLDVIFESFSQADPSTTRKYGGTGLGLSISKHLVNLMNGQIWVKSHTKIGTAFHFTLELSESRAVGSNLMNANSSEWKLAKYSIKTPDGNNKQKENLKILFVEDNPMNAKLAQITFSKMGHTVVSAENGLDALAKLHNQAFDIVFMDCQMPVMDGLTATKKIRQAEMETQTHVPIVAMTANVMYGMREQCLESGMDEYLTKPVKKEEIVKILDKFTKTALTE
jgi:signal transduction histidine kinase/CheY-like chemotaxis protein